MEIKYHLDEKDYINFNVFHLKNSGTAMKMLKIQRFLTPAVYLIAAYFFARIIEGSYVISFIIFGLVALFWVIFYPKYYDRQIQRHVQKMLKEGNNDSLLGEHTMVLSEDGVTDRSRGGVTSAQWSVIQSVKEDAHYMYLYNSSVSAYILPKRDIQNLEEVQKFIQANLK